MHQRRIDKDTWIKSNSEHLNNLFIVNLFLFIIYIMVIATFIIYDPFEGNTEDFIFNLKSEIIMKYYYLLRFYESIIVKNSHNYEKNLYNISFLPDDVVEKMLVNKDVEHKINIARGSFNLSAISYPGTALYNFTIPTILAQAKTELEQKSVTVEYEKVPPNIISAYMELLKNIENPRMAGRKKMFEKDKDGKTVVKYEREQNEKGIYGDVLKPTGDNTRLAEYKWFTHDDGAGFETIGYGHKLTNTEKKSRTITINENYSVSQIDKNGLSDLDIERLLMYDIEKRIRLSQSFLGPARWNWIIQTHPSWAMLLVEKQYNGGVHGLRGWPKMLYFMGLTDSENYIPCDCYTDQEKSSILSAKLIYNYVKLTNKPEKQNYTFTGFKDIPFTPKNEVFLEKNDIYFQSKLQEVPGMGGFKIRNDAVSQTFIYLMGPYYDKYTKKGGGYTK